MLKLFAYYNHLSSLFVTLLSITIITIHIIFAQTILNQITYPLVSARGHFNLTTGLDLLVNAECYNEIPTGY